MGFLSIPIQKYSTSTAGILHQWILRANSLVKIFSVHFPFSTRIRWFLNYFIRLSYHKACFKIPKCLDSGQLNWNGDS